DLNPYMVSAMRRCLASTIATSLAAACVALAACRADVPSPASREDGAMPRSPGPAAAAAGDSLELSIDVPERVQAGEAVPVTVRMRNRTDRLLELHLLGRDIAFDVVVTAEDGTVVWRRLEGEAVQSILHLRGLGPQEALELPATWDQRGRDGSPVPPGLYHVQGIVPTDEPEPLRTPVVPLRIVDGG